LIPVRVIDRMAGFIPGESPPDVSTAIRFMPSSPALLLSAQRNRVDCFPRPILRSKARADLLASPAPVG
jgi:hypothetical protein